MNISEGRRPGTVETIAAAAGSDLLDVHTDPDHNRSVLTLLGSPKALEAASLALARALGGTVINADSMHVYRELRVFTTRPPAAELVAEFARIPRTCRSRRG